MTDTIPSAAQNTERQLYEAVWRGRSEAYAALRAAGAPVATVYANGRGLQHVAAWFGRTGLMADIHAAAPQLLELEDDTGATPLFLAIQSGSTLSLRELLRLGADPGRISSRTVTPVQHMVLFARLDMLQVLADHPKVDPIWWVIPNAAGNTPAHLAAKAGAWKILSWLYAHGANRTDINMAGQTVASMAKLR